MFRGDGKGDQLVAHTTAQPAAITPPATTISGRALHSGVSSTVRVARRADDGLGLRFVFPDFESPLAARDLATLTRRAHRATVLTHPVSGAVIRTPEHLLAAALFFAAQPLDITCTAAEIPGLDGSAKPWYGLLETASNRGASTTPPQKISCHEYETDLTWSYSGPEGSITAEPAARFSVRYTLNRGEFQESFLLENTDDAPSEILPARTFIFWTDWQAYRLKTGLPNETLLDGAREDSGLLLAESREEFSRALSTLPENAENAFPLIHPRTFRLKAEPARHKVLDLLGDLALRTLALPRLRLTITNGGHALNHLLLDALHASDSRLTNTLHEGLAS